MKITVITVCHNAAKTLEKTIKSVLNQTYPNIEYIIIDGGSTDDTVDIIKRYADRLAYWISEPDKGIYDAMNKGIEVATGEWINFMNAGDTFYEEKTIEFVLEAINYKHKIDIIYGSSNLIFKWGNFITHPLPLENITTKMVFVHQSCFVKTQLMKTYKFSNQYKIASDYDFFYHQYKNGKTFIYIPLCIASYDAVYGLSSKNRFNLLIEYGKINESINKKNWKILCVKNIVIIKLKDCIGRFFPNIIVRELHIIKKFLNRLWAKF